MNHCSKLDGIQFIKSCLNVNRKNAKVSLNGYRRERIYDQGPPALGSTPQVSAGFDFPSKVFPDTLSAMRKTLFAVMLIALLVVPAFSPRVSADGPVCNVSVESVDKIHGTVVVRVMAFDDVSQPSSGQTVVVLHDPCAFGNYVVGDADIDYSATPPGQSEDGAFFTFTVPTMSCHGRYVIGVTVYSGIITIFGTSSFKF